MRHKQTYGFLAFGAALIMITAAFFMACGGGGGGPSGPFTVTFVFTEGDDIFSNTSEVVNKGDKVEAPEDPEWDGHVIAGWYKDAGRSNKYDFNTAVKSNLTLYAKWTEGWKVTFHTDHGTEIDPQIFTEVKKATKPADPTKDGYTFGGWYTENTFVNVFDFENTDVTENLDLYAKWNAVVTPGTKFTVSFNANGATGTAPSDMTQETSGAGITLPGKGDLAKDDLTFGGWTVASDGTGTVFAAGASYTPASNIILYAKWNDAETKFTVSFNANGATGGTAPADMAQETSGAGITLPGAGSLVRKNYTFGGWTEAANGSGDVLNAGDTYVPESTITLYAKWIEAFLKSIEEVETALENGTAPVDLALKLDLGIMAEDGSNWLKLLKAIKDAGNSVNLDLSECIIANGTSTTFDVVYDGTDFTVNSPNFTDGRNKIVSLTLPNIATGLVYWNNFDHYGTFLGFTELESFSAAGLLEVKNGCFRDMSKLAFVSLPNVKKLSMYPFRGTAITELDLPALEYLGQQALQGMHLKILKAPALIAFGNNNGQDQGWGGQFQNIRGEPTDVPDTWPTTSPPWTHGVLTIVLGATPPAIPLNNGTSKQEVLSGAGGDQYSYNILNIIIQVPDAAAVANYDDDWLKKFYYCPHGWEQNPNWDVVVVPDETEGIDVTWVGGITVKGGTTSNVLKEVPTTPPVWTGP
ncbi:MAG: InlB B-repeat-containing protein [Treponema sp.]|jgi:uncharacterized repeat protein (TIGR02543 family)|nr:InlB B-repeat-containing protein [Treponema sp.]